MNKQYHSDDWQESERESVILTCVEASESHVFNRSEMTMDILTSTLFRLHVRSIRGEKCGKQINELEKCLRQTRDHKDDQFNNLHESAGDYCSENVMQKQGKCPTFPNESGR